MAKKKLSDNRDALAILRDAFLAPEVKPHVVLAKWDGGGKPEKSPRKPLETRRSQNPRNKFDLETGKIVPEELPTYWEKAIESEEDVLPHSEQKKSTAQRIQDSENEKFSLPLEDQKKLEELTKQIKKGFEEKQEPPVVVPEPPPTVLVPDVDDVDKKLEENMKKIDSLPEPPKTEIVSNKNNTEKEVDSILASVPKKEPEEVTLEEKQKLDTKPYQVTAEGDIELKKSEYRTVPEAEQRSLEAEKVFEEFGISTAELATIKGFRELTTDQKGFVFTHLQRVLYSDIETRAAALLAEETARQGTAKQTSRKIFEGFMGQGGKLALQEAALLKSIRTGGIPVHGETLQLLVDMIKDQEIQTDPETGAQEVAYVNKNEFREEDARVVSAFNKTARAFAAIPENYAYTAASKAQRAQYQTAKKQYEEARRSMFQTACAKRGDFVQAYEFMQTRDTQISLQRVLNTYPPLETVLQNVTRIEGQSHLEAVLKSAARQTGWKGMIAGLGSIIRLGPINTLAASAMEAAMITGGVINGVREGLMTRNKAASEREAARHGMLRKETAAPKSGRGLLGIGKKEHMRIAGHAYRKSDFIDASNYAGRIDALLTKINDPKHEKLSMSQRQLHRLVDMAEAHLASGLVNFGRDAARLSSAFEFTNKLAQARVELARSGWVDQKNAIPNLTYFNANGNVQKISLPEFMNAKHIRMSAEERAFIARGVLRGITVGAVAGGVGAQFAVWVRDQYGDEIQEWIGSLQKKMEAVESGAAINRIGTEGTTSLLEAEATAKKAEHVMMNTSVPPETKVSEHIDISEKTSATAVIPETVAPAFEKFEVTVNKGDTIWGILRRQFSSGEGLDDKRVAEVFNKLGPGAQAHFIDAVENNMRAAIEDELRAGSKTSHKTSVFGITDIDRIQPGQKIDLGPLLKNEDKLLRLVEKARTIGPEKEAIIQKNNAKIADWMKYHRGEPLRENTIDEILYGTKKSSEVKMPASVLEELAPLLEKTKTESALSSAELETITASLPSYEQRTRERLGIAVDEYIRTRTLRVGELLDAVPTDPAQVRALAKSAVKPPVLDVGESEFWKRVRIAAHIRTYTFGKEMRETTVRQFFRGIAEQT